MKRLFVAAVGSALLTVACGGSAPSTSEPPPVETAAAPAAETSAATEAPAPAAAPAVAAPRASAAAPTARTAAGQRTSSTAPAAATPRPAPAPAAAPAPAVPQYREVTVPAGTRLSLRLESTLASDTSQLEDPVRATLSEAVVVGGNTVMPAGAGLGGNVTAVERAGRVKGLARVAFRFTRLTSGADDYDIRTESIERVAEATKGEDAKKVGIGAGAGAAIGAILGGGSGAAKGAAVGAAAGAGTVLATRGEEVRIAPGESVEAHLAAPLTVRVRVR